MPRFLPKLIRNVQADKQRTIKVKLSTRLSVGPRRSEKLKENPSKHTSAIFYGQKMSVLMQDDGPIGRRSGAKFQKKRAPVVPTAMKRNLCVRRPNEMSESECRAWANPYPSPIRRCLLTERRLPNCFLIRIVALRVSSPRIPKSMIGLFPDKLEHPRFRRYSSGYGGYVLCHKEAVKEMVEKKQKYHRIPSPSRIVVHSLFLEQVEYQLQIRVIQELELLAERLRCAPKTSLNHIAIRKLTRQEWEVLKTTQRACYSGAVAILVVPPVKDVSKSPQDQRGITASETSYTSVQSHFPPSVLYDSKVTEFALTSDSKYQIPLYNAVSLFPAHDMRDRLHQALTRVVTIERQARWRQTLQMLNFAQQLDHTDKNKRVLKSSYAYLLTSDADVVRRADTVPLAIALWRLRMWHGNGWEKELDVGKAWATKETAVSSNIH